MLLIRAALRHLDVGCSEVGNIYENLWFTTQSVVSRKKIAENRKIVNRNYAHLCSLVRVLPEFRELDTRQIVYMGTTATQPLAPREQLSQLFLGRLKKDKGVIKDKEAT